MADLWYPGAVSRPLPEATFQQLIIPRLVILHTNGSPNSVPSLYNYYVREDVGGEAHFQLALSGLAEQYMPLNRRADTNTKANRFSINGIYYGAISVETQDAGWGPDDPGTLYPWSDAQMSWLNNFMHWMTVNYNIKPQIVPAWNGEGFGIHRMYPEWTTWPASSYPYKQCPGNVRDNQFRNSLMPNLLARLNPVPPSNGDGLMDPVYIRNSQGWVKALDPYSGLVRPVTGDEYYQILGKSIAEAKLVGDDVFDRI